MKTFFTALIALLVLAACTKKNGSSEVPVDDGKPKGVVIASATIAQGTIIGDQANGEAMIYNDNGKLQLFISKFSSNNGPDLRVYLSTDQSASNFINLGKLKSVSGDQLYDIPGNPNLAVHKFVVIWCAQYAVYFGGGQWK
ncbi:MAG: DM13 domain-containing protein [Gemmatimonadaceae bacterium]|nr:DM13 domain-containing protein [Chitinophagaceae bacterium]